MARGISIRDVNNKVRNINDLDVLPISTGSNYPEVVEVDTLKNYINEDLNEDINIIYNKVDNFPEGALNNIEIENLLNRNNI